MLKFPIVVISTLLCVGLSACASKLEYQSPEQVNLSGDWVLNKELSQEVILPRPQRGSKRSKPKNGGDGRARGGKQSRNQGSGNLANGRQSLHKPDAMTSAEISIEQSIESMGVRYDNNNYRDIDWGKIEYRNTTTIAGWQDETLRINVNGARLSYSEIYQLDSTSEVLTVTFKVGGDEYLRIYNKKSAEG